MKKTLHAEAFVLDRIIDLLAEGSVRHLMEQDDHFADYISELYTYVDKQKRAVLALSV